MRIIRGRKDTQITNTSNTLFPYYLFPYTTVQTLFHGTFIGKQFQLCLRIVCTLSWEKTVCKNPCRNIILIINAFQH